MEILTPILIVGIIGLLAGVILAVASIVMAVPKDEKAEALEEILPGANCGACGFSGCSGYAAAMAKGEAKPGLCSPGGADVAKKCAQLLGGGSRRTSSCPVEPSVSIKSGSGNLERKVDFPIPSGP